MYLTQEIKGAQSRIIYGSIGDKVAILRNDNPCLVIHELGHKFFCDYNLLSNQKIEKSVKEKSKKRV